MRRSLVLVLLLSACAGPRTHDLVGSYWQDDPASVWVVENGLDIRARALCRDGYSVLSKATTSEDTHKEIRWVVACIEP